MITCTFAGHREVFGSCTQKIENALETLIENEDTLYCYVGGMGEFDGFSAAAVRNLKRKYPNKEIRLTISFVFAFTHCAFYMWRIWKHPHNRAKIS